MTDQCGAEALVLPLGRDGEWAQYLDRNESPGCVEQAAAEQDMPGDLACLHRHQGQRAGIVDAQVVHQRGDRTPVSVPEGPPVEVPDGVVVAGPFETKVHGGGDYAAP